MLTLAGIVLLVVLILVGALMPLRYTARMQLPKLPRQPPPDTPAARPADSAGDGPRT